jgi:PAS domain-containing protein
LCDTLQRSFDNQEDDYEILQGCIDFTLGLSDINDVKKDVWECHQHFVERVFRYFRERYSVRLETPNQTMEWEEAEKAEIIFDPVSLCETVDKVLQQLGGQTFKEKRCQEIIDALRKYVRNEYCRDESNRYQISLKGSGVIVDTCIRWEPWCRGEVYGNNFDGFRPFIKGLSLFDCDGNFTTLHPALEEYAGYSLKAKKEDVFRLIPLSMQKVRGIRFYQNGRVDIKFDTAKNAIAFCEYCGMKI